MSIIIEQASPVTLTTTERTQYAYIDTPFGQPYSLRVVREIVKADADNAVLSKVNDRVYNWPFDQIRDETVTVEGVTMTVAQIAGFCQAAFDQLVAEKKATEAP